MRIDIVRDIDLIIDRILGKEFKRVERAYLKKGAIGQIIELLEADYAEAEEDLELKLENEDLIDSKEGEVFYAASSLMQEAIDTFKELDNKLDKALSLVNKAIKKYKLLRKVVSKDEKTSPLRY